MPLAASSDDSVANHSRTTHTLPPISHEGFGGCLLWLLYMTSGREPDHALLTRGLPQGRIKSARVTDDGSIAVVFADQHRSRRKPLREKRIFDPEGFFVLRVLCAPKSDVRVAYNKPDLHYLSLYDDTTALRLIAGAQRGQQVRQVRQREEDGHYDLRRSNLTLTKADPKDERTHQSRAHVVGLALAAYDKLGERHWLRRLLLREDLAWLFAEGFRLLDKRPLGTQAAIAKQDEHRP